MKKTFGKIAVVVMIVSLIAMSFSCSSSKAKKRTMSYNPGTYTASAMGKNGQVELKVTFSNNAITAVDVVNSKETPGLGDVAINKLSTALIESQSLNLDVVSGATFTTVAFTSAVADCVKQAGENSADLFSAPKPALPAPSTKEISTDMVVVGGGSSGMAAAIRARQLGINVVLLEKQAFVGGATLLSGAKQVVMGSDLQKKYGVTDDSVESMVEDFKKNGSNLNVDELITLYARNVGETTNWLNTYVGVQYVTTLSKLPEYRHDRELPYEGGSPAVIKSVRTALEKSGTQVLLNTRATKILTDSKGKVVGIEAKGENNVTYKINAKAVLMATGGYGYNKDLIPSEEMKLALYYGPVSSTGDGLKMATESNVNAATRLLQYGKRYPNGIESAPGIAISTSGGNSLVLKKNAIIVNKAGKRIVNEAASNRTILNAMLKEEGQTVFLVMDAESFEEFKKGIARNGISSEVLTEWLANNGSKTPIFAHGNTVAEAAKAAGVDATGLQDTINRYNSFVRNKKDDDFGRNNMAQELGAGPYYVIEQKPRFATTMGGLVINTSMQVQNTSGKIIEGLYASGEVVGGVMGDDSPVGANNGWAFTSGKLAAESIVKNIK